MLENEIQKLTVAIQELTMEMRQRPQVVSTTKADVVEPKAAKPKAAKIEELKPEPVKIDVPAEDLESEVEVSPVDRKALGALAMEISRAQTSAVPLIKAILKEHNVLTITQLPESALVDVHNKLLGISYDIAHGNELK